ncbi:MAG: phosphogluconate dehydrogenase (NAD(+)-dependent, decarboxylating) [Candidatus Freyarchaeota archaeon]
MKVGMIGLGRMGGKMALRLIRGGHQVVGYAHHAETVNRMVEKGVIGAYSLDELVDKLENTRVVWLMIPAGEPVENIIRALIPRLEREDIIVDGGNSHYRDTMRRAVMLKERGIYLVDVGVSGGIWGLKHGYCLMVGGEREVVEYLRPIFETLTPTPNEGWAHVGPNGAGHFVKMVHNGIEYGLMQAYAEGFALMKRKREFNLDLHQIAEVWRHGSVIRSWLLDLIAQALAEDPELRDVEPYVPDSGEGRWAVFEAIDLDAVAPVMALSLIQRLRSRDQESYSDKLLAVMRKLFGGHAVKKKSRE